MKINSKRKLMPHIIINLLLCYLVSFSFAAKNQNVGPNDSSLISIDYKDANLTSVLKALAYSNDLNLVLAKDVEGVVSANLSNVTVDEALHAILSVNGYAFVRDGGLIYVIPGSGMGDFGKNTETLRLSYLAAVDAKMLLTNVISEGGDIQVNEATNSIVVTDFDLNLNKVKRVLEDVDIPPIQVLIEAKILDIQSKAFENFGTTTSITYDPGGVDTVGGVFKRVASFDESAAISTDFEGPSTSVSGGQMTLTTVMQDLNVSVTIDALIQENKAHLLASPSIATLNGKEARIIIGDRVPIIEKTITDTSTTESTEFVDVGTTLRVTPQVSPDGWITMQVHPEVSSVTANLAAGPNITTREADATIRVKDGQTIIIGGLISKQDDQTEGGIPGLKSIPIVGNLFSNRSKDLQEKELTVFITPKIISSDKEYDKFRKVDDVGLGMQGIGEVNLVSKLLEHANSLESENSVESANKSYIARKEAMLNTYKMIAFQFPDSNEADYALFKTGEMYFQLKQYREAVNIFEMLLDKYPVSMTREMAKDFLRTSREKLLDRQRIIKNELISLEVNN